MEGDKKADRQFIVFKCIFVTGMQSLLFSGKLDCDYQIGRRKRDGNSL